MNFTKRRNKSLWQLLRPAIKTGLFYCPMQGAIFLYSLLAAIAHLPLYISSIPLYLPLALISCPLALNLSLLRRFLLAPLSLAPCHQLHGLPPLPPLFIPGARDHRFRHNYKNCNAINNDTIINSVKRFIVY